MKYLFVAVALFFNFLFAFDGNSLSPKAINLDRVNSQVFNKYALSGYGISHAFVRDKIYPLVYNKRYFAYIIQHDNDPADIYSANFIVQDLLNDKTVYINKFKIDDPNCKYNIRKYLRQKGLLIARKLSVFGLNGKNIRFKRGRLHYKNDTFSLYSKSSKRYYKDLQSNFVVSSKIYLKSAKKGTKVIDKRYYKHPSYILERKPIGFLKLGNNKRVAVVVAKVVRGWEGPPHNIKYEIVGANLEVGFR